jgi:hypothetical protein
MSIAEQFKSFLDENEIFYRDDSSDLEREVFRIPQKLKGGSFVELLVVFYDDSVKIVVLKIASVEDSEKRGEILELFNGFNDSYKYFKVYLNDENDIIVEGDFVTDLIAGDFQPEVLLAYIGAALKEVNMIYPKIMKILWSD